MTNANPQQREFSWGHRIRFEYTNADGVRLQGTLAIPDSYQEGQRLPMSTEILESCFGLFKQLERQHSKGGFTSLLAAFGALLNLHTPDAIREAFARISVQQMQTWVSDNMGKTVASKRQTAYAEYKTAA